MERLTRPAGTGCYTTDQPEAALTRLGRWEDWQQPGKRNPPPTASILGTS